MEKKLSIPINDIRIEAIINTGSSRNAGVVAHPHPLYGGSMDNNVVNTAYRVLVKNNFTALKFNFRGVGASGGQFNDGRGEQDDLVGMVEYLKHQGAESITVIGYSFGAWVAAFAGKQLMPPSVRPLILIAPPAAFMSFDDLSPDVTIGSLICGENDDIAPPQLVTELGARLKQPVVPDIIPGTDHFFGGRENDLALILENAMLSG